MPTNKTKRCPPCRQFTPRLVETYATLKAAGHDVEVVFVSMDRDQAAFDVRDESERERARS